MSSLISENEVVYCGYYMCEHMKILGRYTTDLYRVRRYFLLGIDAYVPFVFCVYLALGLIFFNCRFGLQSTIDKLHEKVLNVDAGLCRFIIHK